MIVVNTKNKTKADESYAAEEETYKQIQHLVCSLYKIKEINRKIIYTNEELKTLVLESDLGQQVITELKELGITRKLLIHFNLIFFNSILGEELPIG